MYNKILELECLRIFDRSAVGTLPKELENGNDVLRVPSLGAVRFCLYPAAAPETAAPILPPDTTLTSLVRQPSPHLADVQSQKEIGHEAHHGRFCSLYRNDQHEQALTLVALFSLSLQRARP